MYQNTYSPKQPHQKLPLFNFGTYLYTYKISFVILEYFKISKTYNSVAAMEASYSTDGLPIGSLVVIETGDVNNPDNAKLYVKTSTQYSFLTDMSGTQGIQGPQGIQGIQGNKGETGATFTPSVDTNGNLSWTNNKGLSNPATVNIKGDKGDQGSTGANGKTPTLTINDKGELISTIED